MINAADIKRGNVIMVLGRREVITKTQSNYNGTITYWSRPINEVGVGVAHTVVDTSW